MDEQQQDMSAWIQAERERVAADLAQSKKQHAERLAAMAPPPRDPMEEWRQQANERSEREAQADRRRRVAERLERRSAARAQELVELEQRIEQRLARRFEQRFEVLRYALDEVVAGALDTLNTRLVKLDVETKQSFADVFGRLVHCLELIQPAQPQATRPPADRLRAVN